MAEFIEVMNKKKEICYFYNCCSKCVLSSKNNGMHCTCSGLVLNKPIEAEEIIMSWEKPIDWSTVEVDTPILVKNDANFKWKRRYFAKYKNNKVYAWRDGCTSWTAEGATEWNYAKFAESTEEYDR